MDSSQNIDLAEESLYFENNEVQKIKNKTFKKILMITKINVQQFS